MKNVQIENKETSKEIPPWLAPAENLSENLSEKVEDTEKISIAEKSLLQKVIRKGLVENKNDLEVQRKDPNSPLYSVKSFEALNL